ncbi:MAG: M24 family metallopeptidase, partial [Firmicutes bacterium]|nr:M24 family metallopeptidase [Bacillota bacterium]
IPGDVRAWHDAATQIDAAAITATRPGRPVSDVYHEIVKTYGDTDYPDEWQKHHLGGATGYLVRDYLATEASKETIRNNQAFAWNPSVHGMRSEDTIIATEDGPDIITHTGNWPMRSIRVSDDTDIVRPDILVR